MVTTGLRPCPASDAVAAPEGVPLLETWGDAHGSGRLVIVRGLFGWGMLGARPAFGEG